MRRGLIVFVVVFMQAPLARANVVTRAAKEAKSLALAPLHWTSHEWTRFAEGTAAVAAVYAADPHLYDAVQRHRTPFTNDFAKTITPFGGRRALDISALMWLTGHFAHNDTLNDAGRDSLEAEVWAGGVVTPAIKRIAGRARPIQGEGAHSFQPFSSSRQSFPSGHATNAFAFATGIAAHYDGWVVPTIVYTIASGVAMSRVHDRAHFPSDVLAGALIGRAVAKGVVARHSSRHVSWTVTPAFTGGRPAVVVRVRYERGELK